MTDDPTEPVPLVGLTPHQPDELDQIAATRVVSVVVRPMLDKDGTWKLWVDHDESIDPWQARAFLKSGVKYMQQFFPEEVEEEEEDE